MFSSITPVEVLLRLRDLYLRQAADAEAWPQQDEIGKDVDEVAEGRDGDGERERASVSGATEGIAPIVVQARPAAARRTGLRRHISPATERATPRDAGTR